MAIIDNIKVGNNKYNLKDSTSGFGTFSAEQVMQNTVPGATLVGTLKYRTFSTTNKTFGATNTVNLYSTPGSSSGNSWVASVEGITLTLSSSGSAPTPSETLMPDLSGKTGSEVVDALLAVGMIESTRAVDTYTVLCNNLQIKRRIKNEDGNISTGNQYTYNQEDTFTALISNFWGSMTNLNYSTPTVTTQQPLTGTTITTASSITVTFYTEYVGGGTLPLS